MKKTLIFLLIVGSLILLNGCAPKCSNGLIVCPGGCCLPDSPNSMNQVLCESSGSNWNNCGSKCQIDHQGTEGIMCPAVCEEICECGGFAGFHCPPGYTCKTPPNLMDAGGYCIPTNKANQCCYDITLLQCTPGQACMPNPASWFCNCVGGKSEIQGSTNSYISTCVVNNLVYNEWDYFRDNCPNNPFIG